MNRIRRYRGPEVDEVAPKDDRIDVIMKELEFLRSELAKKKDWNIHFKILQRRDLHER
jgi:hypothetical protein